MRSAVAGPLVAMVEQRHPADCGAAVLAMYLGVSYEEALMALTPEAPRLLRKGVWMTQLIRAGAKLGARLVPRAAWDPEVDEGIAQIRFRVGPRHVVVCRAGLFFDTDLTIWEPTDYYRARQATPGPLLVLA